MKKVFILSAIFLGVTIFIFGVYNFAFKKSQDKVQTIQNVQQNPESKKAIPVVDPKKQEKIVQFSKEPVIGAVSDKKTEKIFYYSALNGNVWQVDSDGSNEKKVTNTLLTGLTAAFWSPDKTKVLTRFDNNGKVNFFSYDNIKKIGTPLGGNIDNIVVWDSLGARIIYKYFDSKSGKRSLSIANPDGSEWKTLASDIKFRKVSIAAVPLSSFVSFWNFPSASEESSLQVVAATGGEVRNILKGRFGADYLWSPDGSQALVSSLINKESKTTTLGLVDMQGQYRDLNIPTIVSKCVWSADGNTIYYALPGGIPVGAVMPNDYMDKKFETNDTFWKIDITNGSKERIVELDDIKTNYDVSDPFLSATEDALFFTNRIDGKLYRIGF